MEAGMTAVDTAPTAVRIRHLLQLADSPLILGQQLGAYVGSAPILEEEMACANLGLDLLGHATMLLEYAAYLTNNSSDSDAQVTADTLAFTRDARAMYNLLLCERPNSDFAHVMVRHLFYSTWSLLLWTGLSESSDERLAAIAAKAVKEMCYHCSHSAGWVIRLGDGTAESHARTQAAIDELLPYVGEMFLDDARDSQLNELGTAPLPSSLADEWESAVRQTVQQATLAMPALNGNVYMHSGGTEGVHSERLGFILAEMQYLQRSYPGLTW